MLGLLPHSRYAQHIFGYRGFLLPIRLGKRKTGGGIVESVGEGVTNVKVGDHVIPLYTAGKSPFSHSNRDRMG